MSNEKKKKKKKKKIAENPKVQTIAEGDRWKRRFAPNSGITKMKDRSEIIRLEKMYVRLRCVQTGWQCAIFGSDAFLPFFLSLFLSSNANRSILPGEPDQSPSLVVHRGVLLVEYTHETRISIEKNSVNLFFSRSQFASKS